MTRPSQMPRYQPFDYKGTHPHKSATDFSFRLNKFLNMETITEKYRKSKRFSRYYGVLDEFFQNDFDQVSLGPIRRCKLTQWSAEVEKNSPTLGVALRTPMGVPVACSIMNNKETNENVLCFYVRSSDGFAKETAYFNVSRVMAWTLAEYLLTTEPLNVCSLDPQFVSIATSRQSNKSLAMVPQAVTSESCRESIKKCIMSGYVMIGIVPRISPTNESKLCYFMSMEGEGRFFDNLDNRKEMSSKMSPARSEWFNFLCDLSDAITLSVAASDDHRNEKDVDVSMLVDDDNIDWDAQMPGEDKSDDLFTESGSEEEDLDATDGCDCKSCVARTLHKLQTLSDESDIVNHSLEMTIEKHLSSSRVKKNNYELDDEVGTLKNRLVAMRKARIKQQRQTALEEEMRKKAEYAEKKALASARRREAEKARKEAEQSREQERRREQAVQSLVQKVAKDAIANVIKSVKVANQQQRLAYMKKQEDTLKKLRAMNAQLAAKEREVVSETEKRKKECTEEAKVVVKVKDKEAVKQANPPKAAKEKKAKPTRETPKKIKTEEPPPPKPRALVAIVKAPPKPLPVIQPVQHEPVELSTLQADNDAKTKAKEGKKAFRRAACNAAGFVLTKYARGFLGRLALRKAIAQKLEDDTKKAIEMSMADSWPTLQASQVVTQAVPQAVPQVPRLATTTYAKPSGDWKPRCRHGESCKFFKLGTCRFYHGKPNSPEASGSKDVPKPKTEASTNSLNECSICMNDMVEPCALQCGHIFCKTCSDRLTDTCFTCMQPIKAKIKLFV